MNNSKIVIEAIISQKIFDEHNVCDWKQYKENIIRSLNNINYMESIKNYVPCERKLYLTRPKMRILLYLRLQQNSNIFKEVGYEKYEGRNEPISFIKDLSTFVEECVKILVNKQRGK